MVTKSLKFYRGMISGILALSLILHFTLGSQALAQDPSMMGKESAAAEDDPNEILDPFEGLNRGIFWFNDTLDVYVLEPIASGYDYVMPNQVQNSIGNFFHNARYPSRLVSDVVQFKFSQAAHHTSRFLINTTLGLVGLFDVAAEFGLEKHNEDFGTALAYHGVPAGPYIVIPIVGPSNVRDGVGRIVDAFLDPLWYIGDMFTARDEDTYYVWLGYRTVEVVQTRADLLDAIEAAKDASLDYYLFTQSAYYQYRDGLVNDKSQSDSWAIDSQSSEAEGAEQNDVDAWLNEDEEFLDE